MNKGDPSDNAVKFHAWLKEKAEMQTNDMAHVRYTVFGLGNKQYQHYNAMGKFVDTKLDGLGASRIYKYGEGISCFLF